MNDHCYHTTELRFSEGVLDSAVNMAYLLTMVDSNREWQKELYNFPLSSKVTVVYNMGFRNCKKQLVKQISYCDLQDAVLYIFNDALRKGYQRILVLEDDFQILEKKKEHYYSVEDFIKKKNPDVYNLGPMITLCGKPSILTHNASWFFTTTHAVIYNQNYITYFVQKAPHRAGHVDTYFNKASVKKYTYYMPLIGQTFPMTENRQSWPMSISYLSDMWISVWRLDTSCQNYKYQQWFLTWVTWLVGVSLLIYSCKKIILLFHK